MGAERLVEEVEHVSDDGLAVVKGEAVSENRNICTFGSANIIDV